MEKHSAHYDLKICHELLNAGSYRITHSSLASAYEVDMYHDDIIHVVGHLNRKMLYKSMTTHADHTIWQDVYHTQHRHYKLYVKLTISDGACLVVVSFKEL